MNPPTTAPLVDNATPMLFPDGNLAYDNDEELSHLQEARRKASGNAEMMREIESDSFTANLLDRQTGRTVSASERGGAALSMATGGSLRLELGLSSPTLMVRCLSLHRCLRFTRIFRLPIRCHSVYVSVLQLVADCSPNVWTGRVPD